MFIALITLAVLLAACAVFAGRGGRRVVARCGMASAFCGYADALTIHHAPTWQPAILVAAACLLLVHAIYIAVTRKSAQPKADA